LTVFHLVASEPTPMRGKKGGKTQGVASVHWSWQVTSLVHVTIL
jgi:hypothetical protein